MKKLQADLQNGIKKNIYLLYGSQAYLRNQYRDRLVKMFLPEGDTLNYAHFEGTEIDLNEVISLSDTVPFLAEFRVIVLENTGLFDKSCDELAEYIPNIPESTVLIFSEEDVDARLKAFKAAKSKGTAAEFNNLSEDDLKRWVVKKLADNKTQMTVKALDFFIANCGTDMLFIQTELEKLIAYTMDKDGIYPEDVEAICTVKVEDKVFLMLDAMFRHNADEALKYYGDLLALHQAPLMILGLIENQLRLLLHLRQMSNERLSEKQMASALSMNEYRVKKALPQARKSSKIWIMKGLELCADIEEAAKSGRMTAQIGLETVICTLAQNVG